MLRISEENSVGNLMTMHFSLLYIVVCIFCEKKYDQN